MPRPSARQSAPPSRTPTIRAAARATRAPPAVATSCSWSATIGRLMIGRSPVSSNATCAWTTTSASAISAPRGRSRARAWSAISSIKPSTPSGPSKPRSRSEEMPPNGWTSSAPFQASTWKVRNIGGPITGPSGVGIESAPARQHSPHPSRDLSNAHSHPDRPPCNQLNRASNPHVLQMASQRVVAVRVPPGRRGPAVLADHVLPAHRGGRPARLIRISAEEGSTGQ